MEYGVLPPEMPSHYRIRRLVCIQTPYHASRCINELELTFTARALIIAEGHSGHGEAKILRQVQFSSAQRSAALVFLLFYRK